MRCSRRSTTWCRSLALLAAAVLSLGAAGDRPGAGSVSDGEQQAAVGQAIVSLVRETMGADADVRLEDLRTDRVLPAREGEGTLLAKAEPGARLARTVRFSLFRRDAAGARRAAGYALAHVRVLAPHARAARAIARGETLAPGDIVMLNTDLGPVPLRRLPDARELVGTRALRDVAIDEVLTRALVAVRPAVQSGDVVSMRAVAEGLTVQAQGVAAQSGEVGAVIRVVNPSSRRGLRARVLEPGKVEVLQ